VAAPEEALTGTPTMTGIPASRINSNGVRVLEYLRSLRRPEVMRTQIKSDERQGGARPLSENELVTLELLLDCYFTAAHASNGRILVTL
jgi:hypothetical protein